MNFNIIFNNTNNCYYGHGTRGNVDKINSIFNNGLRCSNNSMYFTTCNLGFGGEIEDEFCECYEELRNMIYNKQTINGYMGMVRNDISSLNKCNLNHTSADKSERKINKLLCNIFRCLITVKYMIMEEEFSIKLDDYYIDNLLNIKKGNKYKLDDGSIYMPELLDDVSKYIYDIEVLKHNMSIPERFDSKKGFELILDFYKSNM